jgi:hypothetical protein
MREPLFWRDPAAKPGDPNQEGYLVKIPGSRIASHTAVVAQSGSGKSFFLGRLVEEIVLKTKSRCIILDPNADFKRLDQVTGEQLWSKARYDGLLRRGKLPHETSQEEFAKYWRQISIRIRGTSAAQGNYELLKLWCPSLSMDFLGGDLDPMLRSDLYHCHAFIQALDVLWRNGKAKNTQIDLFDEGRKLFSRARNTSDDKLRDELTKQFLPDDDSSNSMVKKLFNFLPETVFDIISGKKWVRDSIERIITAPKYVSDAVERFYFGKIREYIAAGIVETNTRSRPSPSAESKRIEVIDLPSLDKSTRLMAVNALLNAEWEAARKAWNEALQKPEEQDTRVPTFIVVDEAHNLMPLEPQTKAESALRDQFRTIIAEGRKYGLFLVIVSQRPDKLDRMILAECENKAIMRLGSASVLDLAKNTMGLEDFPPKLLAKCLEFEAGRVLLAGEWSRENPQIIYVAARRTIEGGRNLRSEYWAHPVEIEKSAAKAAE